VRVRGALAKGWRAALFVPLVGFACGGTVAPDHASAHVAPPSQAPPHGTYTSGKRLRARFWDGGGGATSFIDWYDTALQIPCAFGVGEDRVMRCLPSTPPPETSMFLDPACTKPARMTPSATVLPYEASSRSVGTCGPTTVVHVDTPQTVDVATVFQEGDSGCIAVPVPPGDLVAELVPADLTLFLEADVVVEDRGQGLDGEVIVARDGTRQVGRTLDHARGAPCSASDGRCFPLDRITSEEHATFMDAACTQPGPGGFSCALDPSCPAPSIALDERFDPTTCKTTLAGVHAVGPRAPLPYQAGGPGECAQVSLNGSACAFFAEAAPIDASAFPPLAEGRIGTGRLVEPVLLAPDGHPVADLGGFIDTQRGGITCFPTLFADGAERCVGGVLDLTSIGVFADAACTQPLAPSIASSSCSAGSVPPAYAAQSIMLLAPAPQGGEAPAWAIQHVFAVGTRFDATPYLQAPGGACTAGTPGNYALLSPEVDPDSAFARVEGRTQP
jgi:hypothetical protein